MGGRWRRTLSLLCNRIISVAATPSYSSPLSKPHFFPSPFSTNRFLTVAAQPALDPDPHNPDPPLGFGASEPDPSLKIPVKAFFLSTRFPLPITPSFLFLPHLLLLLLLLVILNLHLYYLCYF